MSRTTIYYARRGSYVHCRVFVNGGRAGELFFRDTEWLFIGPGLRSIGWDLIEEGREAA